MTLGLPSMKSPELLKQAIAGIIMPRMPDMMEYSCPSDKSSKKRVDHLFLYYRHLLTALSSGWTPKKLFGMVFQRRLIQLVAGRNMSNHFAKPPNTTIVFINRNTHFMQ
jgi:2-oxoisovalerate dehydrogenase E1 component